jgi:hypothetical protein
MGQECGGRDQYGYTPEERGNLSTKGELCGMMGCSVPPEQTCRSCSLWYCMRHFTAHFAGYPEHKSGKPIL